MPIARYWCVSTGGNEVTAEMAQAWKDNFLAYALENGCIRGALAADEDTIIAVSLWPDMETMNSVIDTDGYWQVGKAVQEAFAAGGIIIPDDVTLVVNGELLALAGAGVDM